MFRVGSRYFASLCIVFLAAATGLASAQSDKPAPTPTPVANDPQAGAPAAAQSPDQVDPLKRAPTEKQKKQQKSSLKIELGKTYKKWLNEDVVWIITDEERAAFKQLSNDEERDNFIEAFWQ